MVAPVQGGGSCAGAYGEVFSRRVTALGGHFGSGKTELTLSAALALASSFPVLSLVDLDLVKPYLRSRSARGLLKAAGVELVAPLGEYFSADLPIVLPEIRNRLVDPGRKILLDVGGDDLGVRALASLSDAVPPSETDFFLIVNFRRPLTPDVASAAEMALRIAAVSRLRPTGLLANTHLMGETTAEVVLDGLRLAEEAGRSLGLPVRGVGVPEALAADLADRTGGVPVLPVRRIVRPPFEMDRERRTVGPLFVVG
ncbi:MAG: hypothetical protein ACP5VN_04255 [Acidobacteriota bacterium]